MGKHKKTKFPLTLEKKIERYYKLTQSQSANIALNEKMVTLWDDIIQDFSDRGMRADVFINGGHLFLGEPVDILAQLKENRIKNYDLFIAELEDCVNHYQEIVEQINIERWLVEVNGGSID